MPKTYYEDLEVGQEFGGQQYVVDAQEMIEFARKWDPRPIHLDDRAGREAGFGGLIASGAYTTAIFTLLGMQSRERDGEHAIIAGLGAESRLASPVRGTNTLTYRAEILSKRESGSRPGAGILRTRALLLNEEDEIVYEATTVTLIEKRPAQESTD